MPTTRSVHHNESQEMLAYDEMNAPGAVDSNNNNNQQQSATGTQQDETGSFRSPCVQKIVDFLATAGWRFWSICDLTHNNIRSPALLALTLCFVMAGALSFLVLLLSGPDTPGIQINIVALPNQRQLFGTPLNDFSVQLQRANGVAMSGVELKLTLRPALPFRVDTSIMNQLVPNLDIDCQKDKFWGIRPYFCNMKHVPGAQNMTSARTDENGIAKVRGLQLNYGQPGDYELIVETSNADPVLPDVQRTITVGFFASVDDMTIISTSYSAVTGVLAAEIDVYVADSTPEIVGQQIASVIPMRFPRVANVIPGWLPVSGIRVDDEPIFDSSQQFFRVTNTRLVPVTSDKTNRDGTRTTTIINTTVGRISCKTKLIGATGRLFGAAVFFGGRSVPITSVSDPAKYFPETVAYPLNSGIANVATIQWGNLVLGEMPPPDVLEASRLSVSVTIRDSSGKGVPGVVVSFRALRALENAAVSRKVEGKFLVFNTSSPSDADGVATLRSDYFFSLSGEVGRYFVYGTVGPLTIKKEILVRSRVRPLPPPVVSTLMKEVPIDLPAAVIQKSRIQFVVLDNVSNVLDPLPLPGKVAKLELVVVPPSSSDASSDFEWVRVETEPTELVSDFQGYFYVDGIRAFVAPKKHIIAARNFTGFIKAYVDDIVVHVVPVNVHVSAKSNTTKKSSTSNNDNTVSVLAQAATCMPINITVQKRSISKPYAFRVILRATTFDNVPITDLFLFSPNSDDGFILEPYHKFDGPRSGFYVIRPASTMTNVEPFAIYRIFFMTRRCRPRPTSVSPWISGQFLTFAMMPEARNITTLSRTDDMQTNEYVIKHNMTGPKIGDGVNSTVNLLYWPSWFPRGAHFQSTLGTRGINVTCVVEAWQPSPNPQQQNPSSTLLECRFTREVATVPGLYYFVPNYDGVFFADIGDIAITSVLSVKSAVWFAAGSSALISNDNRPVIENVAAFCAISPSFPVFDVSFNVKYAPAVASGGPVPKGTPVYFKLRINRFSPVDGSASSSKTYDMWETPKDMSDAGMARLFTADTDPVMKFAPSPTSTDPTDEYGENAASSSSSSSSSSRGTSTTSQQATEQYDSYTGAYADGFDSSGVAAAATTAVATAAATTAAVTSTSITAAAAANFTTTTTTTTTPEPTTAAPPQKAPPGQDMAWIGPPLAFTSDNQGSIAATLMDLAGFRALSKKDTFEVVVFVDNVEVTSATIPITKAATDCEFNYSLVSPVKENIIVPVPSVLAPGQPFGFSWSLEDVVTRWGTVANVECLDSVTMVSVACLPNTAYTGMSFYSMFFISKTPFFAADGIVFPAQAPTQRIYYVNVRFPGFADTFRVGQVYLGVDSCVGQVVQELPSPIYSSTAYTASVQFTCAQLPLRQTLVVASMTLKSSGGIDGGDGENSDEDGGDGCAGSSCGVLSSPRDFSRTDSNGVARFKLLIAAAPAGKATFSFVPATRQLYAKAAALDAVFTIGVGKKIHGRLPKAATANVYEVQDTGVIARLFSAMSSLLAQENKPAQTKPVQVETIGLRIDLVQDLEVVPNRPIMFKTIEDPVRFLKDPITIRVIPESSELGLMQRVSMEVWDEKGEKQVVTNWVTFANKVRQWFMTSADVGEGSLPANAFFHGPGGTFTIRFNCRGVLSPPTKPFTVINPQASTVADLQAQAQEMVQVFLGLSTPMLLANVPQAPVLIVVVALGMCLAAIVALPAVAPLDSMLTDTPLLGFHVLVTYLVVYLLALGFFTMTVHLVLRRANSWARSADGEERMLRAFRYYRWLANRRSSKTKTEQDEFTDVIEEETNSIRHRMIRPARKAIDKIFSWHDTARENFNELAFDLGEWEDIRALDFEAAPAEPPEYLLPATPSRYVVVMAISGTLLFFMSYAGFRLLQFIDMFLLVFHTYLSSVGSASANIFNAQVLSTLKGSVDFVISQFPKFSFLRSLIPLIERIDLGGIINTINVVVEELRDHVWGVGIAALAISVIVTLYLVSRVGDIKKETLKQRRKINRGGELGNAENYTGTHTVMFAFQALASFLLSFVGLLLLMLVFRNLGWIWNSFWESPVLANIGAIAITTGMVKLYMEYFAHTKLYITQPTIYGLWIIPSALHSVFEGVAVLFYRVFVHFFVGFGFAFTIVSRPLTDPVEDPVYEGFLSMATVEAMYSNPAFLAAIGYFLTVVEQKKFYESRQHLLTHVAGNDDASLFHFLNTTTTTTTVDKKQTSGDNNSSNNNNKTKVSSSCFNALAAPADFGKNTFYPHVGHMIRIWVSFDMSLFDREKWFAEARRDPADDEAQQDPMSDEFANNLGIWSKFSHKIWFKKPASDIAMTTEDVARAVPPENLVDPTTWPFEQPRWPLFSRRAMHFRRIQRRWYLLILLHRHPVLIKWRKHNLLLLSGYHFAPEGSVVEKMRRRVDQVKEQHAQEHSMVVALDGYMNDDRSGASTQQQQQQRRPQNLVINTAIAIGEQQQQQDADVHPAGRAAATPTYVPDAIDELLL